MKLEQAKFLKQISDECGNQECEIHENYSGRGMFGKETVGIVIDSPLILLADVLNYYLENNKSPDDIYLFDGFKQDNMGRSIIIY